MSAIGENMRILRIIHGQSQKDLAIKLGKVPNTISNWERGDTFPDTNEMEQLCNIYGLTPNQICGWETCAEIEKFKYEQDDVYRKMKDLKEQKEAIEAELAKYMRKINERMAKFNSDTKN